MLPNVRNPLPLPHASSPPTSTFFFSNTDPQTENLDKTKVTGVSQVDQLQDGVNGLVSGQVGKGGLAQPIGDMVSKEGLNRAERGGKDENGKPLEAQGPLGGYGQSAADGVKSGAGSVGEGVKSGAGSVGEGVKGAGGYLGGMWGGKKEEKK